MGLLHLAAVLRIAGYRVSYMDCLDRFHPYARHSAPKTRNGRGPYLKTRIPKPPGLEHIPRNFSRYGIKEKWFRQDLQTIDPPDLVMITSMMTYWYPGVQETVRTVQSLFPAVPIVLGGVYATLCRDHAIRTSGANTVISGSDEFTVLEWIAAQTGYSGQVKFSPDHLDAYPYPAFDLQCINTYIPLRTSIGCPLTCSYCASNYLHPRRSSRRPTAVVEEIEYWHRKFGIMDFAFYDDALLEDAENHIIPLLEKILTKGLPVRFHTPNALHIGKITSTIARLMFHTGFETVRLGLETAIFDRREEIDRKLTAEEFKRSVEHLKRAGFTRRQIGAYLLVGLPGQPVSAVERSMAIVKDSGVTPIPAYYSPVPHTAMWPRAVAVSRYDLESDPIFTNNAILPCLDESFSWQIISRLKKLTST